MLNGKREIVVLDAPSNLGLRPPVPGAVPGVYKLAGALRDQRLLERLDAADGGVIVPPRYQSQWKPGDGVRNERAIERFSLALADRVTANRLGAFGPLWHVLHQPGLLLASSRAIVDLTAAASLEPPGPSTESR